MKVEKLVEIMNVDFYTGIPDSQLNAFCNYLINVYGEDYRHHIIAANEGNCVAIAAGYHMATGKIPVVYMQNSGQGNIINPVVSLLNEKVYAIPTIFIIGWRGEPEVHDEPQHIFQGEITLKLLEDIGISFFIIDKNTTDEEVRCAMNQFNYSLSKGRDVAFVIKKGALKYNNSITYGNNSKMIREEIIRHIVKVADKDPIIATTGKISRELYEIREKNGQSHKYDFLTVGSMGHSSSIALGMAIHKPCTKVWCVDGDGAVLMHMGAMAVIGVKAPENMIHVIINNEAHESVGGMPTVAGRIDFISIAKACGYSYAVSVDNYSDLEEKLMISKQKQELSMIEVKCSIGSRDDLGRPTSSARENKENFMKYLLTL